MAELHVQHLKANIDQYLTSTSENFPIEREPLSSLKWPSGRKNNEVKMVDKSVLKQKMVDKWSIKPTLAEKLVDIMEFVADKESFTTEEIVHHFGFTPTTAKRYLRQLTEFGYMEARGGNRNRSYRFVSFS